MARSSHRPACLRPTPYTLPRLRLGPWISRANRWQAIMRGNFRTGAVATAPTVISTSPVNGAMGVPINQSIDATFSEAMNPVTIKRGQLYADRTRQYCRNRNSRLYCLGVDRDLYANRRARTEHPVYGHDHNRCSGSGGNALASNFVWTFTTGTAPNTTKPTVISTSRRISPPECRSNQVLSATFSAAMNPLSISTATFTLTGPGTTSVAGLVTYAGVGNTATFTPTAPLAPSTLLRPRSQPGPRIWRGMRWPATLSGLSPPAQHKAPSSRR